MTDAEHYAKCPQAKYHGKPFRYCPEKGCGWIEPQPAPQCMFMGCDSSEIDERGPVVLRDGSKHYACTEHWEPIMRVIGQQRTWEQEAMTSSTCCCKEDCQCSNEVLRTAHVHRCANAALDIGHCDSTCTIACPAALRR